MARSMNKVFLLGNLGKDPELKYLPSGVAVCNFSIATTKSWKDTDGNVQEKTEWHNIVSFRKVAELCGEYLKKGSKVLVEGELQTRMWEKDGVKHYTTEVVLNEVTFLDGGKKDSSPSKDSVESVPVTAVEGNSFDSGELPF